MFVKISKRIAVLVLVICYCLGQMVFPIHANNDAGTSSSLDALLAERNESVWNVQEAVQETQVKIEDLSDVKENDWFYPYLEYLVSKQLIKGKTNDSFEPNSSFSYAECSAIIVRYLGLEDEAQERMQDIAKRYPEMKNFWYAGYFEVMMQLGLFSGYGLFESDGKSITHIDKDLANSPISRYRFAESISLSFELDSDLKAKNVYSEIGGSGREFIVGGAYKNEVLDAYKNHIADYDSIPEESQINVLKAYYNGIFNGDISGNFYPLNNLSRAEMAKVLAVISDSSLRTRLITDSYGQKITDDMLHTDAFGVKTLGYEVWKWILEKESENLSVGEGVVQYKSSGLFPEGYAVDVYLYEKTSSGYELGCECTLRNGNDGGFTYEAQNVRVLFVLRNTNEYSKTVGVYDVTVENSSIVSAKPLIRYE